MRKSIGIIILFIFMACLISAKSNEKVSDNIYTNIKKHEISIFLTDSVDSNKIMVSDKMYMDVSEIPVYLKSAFFLSKDFDVYEVLIDGYPIDIFTITTLSEEYFNGRLTISQLDSLNTFSSLYEVLLPPFKKGQTECILEVKYNLKTNNNYGSIKKVGEKYVFDGTKLWYPENIVYGADSMKVTFYLPFEYQGVIKNLSPKIEKKEYYQKTIFDINPAIKNLSLEIIKS